MDKQKIILNKLNARKPFCLQWEDNSVFTQKDQYVFGVLIQRRGSIWQSYDTYNKADNAIHSTKKMLFNQA